MSESVRESREVETQIPTGVGCFEVIWVEGDKPVELVIPVKDAQLFVALTAQEAFTFGDALKRHAIECGVDPGGEF